MYVLTEKAHDEIIEISKTLEYESNGNPLIHNKTLAIGHPVNVYEVEEVPEEVIEHKYCYTPEDGFFLNKRYIAPISEEQFNALSEEVTELQLAMVELAGGN